ncbi:MAG: lytic transglycosylase domain-containing protein [bacterium]
MRVNNDRILNNPYISNTSLVNNIDSNNNQNNLNNVDKQNLIRIQQNLAENFHKALGYESVLPQYLSPNQRKEIIQAVEEASTKYQVDKALILAVITKESGFNYKATSKVGAKGLMQLNSDTIKFINSNNKDLKITNPYDIKQNVMGGTYYLKYLLNKFDGDLRLVLGAYNAGPNSKTVKTLKKYSNIDVSKVPLNRETKTYIKSVINYYEQYLKYYK